VKKKKPVEKKGLPPRQKNASGFEKRECGSRRNDILWSHSMGKRFDLRKGKETIWKRGRHREKAGGGGGGFVYGHALGGSKDLCLIFVDVPRKKGQAKSVPRRKASWGSNIGSGSQARLIRQRNRLDYR